MYVILVAFWFSTANNTKKFKFKFILGTLDVSLLENLLIGKRVEAKISGQGVITAGKVTFRAAEGF